MRPLRFLLLIAGLMLASAVLNVAGLASAQALGRRAEFAIRRAMGASRWQCLRQLMTEGLVPVIAGTVLAAPLSLALSRFISESLWTGLAPISLTLDLGIEAGIVLLACCALMLLAFGLAPSLSLSRRDVSIRTSEARVSRAVSGSLTVGQVALSLTLSVVAVLMAQSFWRLQDTHLGYRKTHLALTRLLQVSSNSRPADGPAHYAGLLANIAQIPGVRRAAYASAFPRPAPDTAVAVDAPGSTPTPVAREAVSDDFFDTVGISLVEGRLFSGADGSTSSQVAVVSQKLSTALFPGVSAIGRFVAVGVPAVTVQIVGVVSDTWLNGPRAPASSAIYRPRSQEPRATFNPVVIVQAETSSRAVIAPLVKQIALPGRDYAIAPSTIEQDLNRGLASERTFGLLALLFSAFVILLAGIGLFALQSTSVLHHRRQIAIRMALGEGPRSASVRLAWGAFRLVVTGISVGMPIAVLLSYTARNLLFGLSPFDVPTLLMVGGWFLATGALISLLPTRTIFRLNLIGVLKADG